MIDILMAAYNGEKFVAAQIESILAQTDADWRLVVRDDRSTDSTPTIVDAYAQRQPRRIVARSRSENSGSASRNFLEMLLASQAPYVMFADDDDVWLPDKIALTMSTMRHLEGQFGADTPLLVHTDLRVVDSGLAVVSDSMADFQRLDGTESRLPRLLVQNVATGCTVMVNRRLADLVREPFDSIIMHDWWLLLIASAFGRIGYLDTPTVLHRQHGANAVGAIAARSPLYNLRRLRDAAGTAMRMADSLGQAAAFLDRFGGRLSPAQVEVLEAYVAIPSLGKLGRLRALGRHGFWKNTATRRLAQAWFI